MNMPPKYTAEELRAKADQLRLLLKEKRIEVAKAEFHWIKANRKANKAESKK